MKRFSGLQEDLRKWFDKDHPEGGWKRINSKGEAIGPCAREPGEPKPKCMSNEKRAKLSKKERASAVASKRKHDPNPERKGEPINVSNFGKGKISEDMENLEEKNVPTSPEKWAQAKAQAKAKFDVYPSAYANGWAAKKYKAMGGGWKSVSESEELDEARMTAAMKLQKAFQREQEKTASERKAGEELMKKPEPVKEGNGYDDNRRGFGKPPREDDEYHVPDPTVKKSKMTKEETDTSEKNEMAQTQLHFIKYAAEEILEYIEMGGKIEEWYQNKLSKVQSEVESLHSYVEGESRRTGMKEEVEQLEEGRPSQRHPLEGHEYHKKTNAELEYIAKDAHKAAEAMKSHNTAAENKYRDQANDSATVRYYRQKNGMQPWYKKKYGHVNEEVMSEQKPPFDGPYKKSPKVVTDKSGAEHTPMSRARDLARDAMKKVASLPKKKLNESRQAEIVKQASKDAKKKSKEKKSDDTFQAQPTLDSQVIKTD